MKTGKAVVIAGAIILLILFLLGVIIGSFLNVLIFRWHENKSPLRGRSQCPDCHKTLRWFELIPVLSFLLQKGRCRGCHQKISWQYPLVELATALLFVSVSIFNQPQIYYFIASVLMVIFVYDLRFGEIPHIFTWPIVAILLLWSLFSTDKQVGNLIAGILIGGSWFAFQYFVSRGRWIGGGDIGLGALMGAILGWPSILVALFLAYVSGAIICLPLLLLKKKALKSAIPFGVFLVPATFITLWWGQNILDWYLKII